MKIIVFLLFILLGNIIDVNAQVRGLPEPTPQSESDKALSRQSDIGRRSNELRNTEAYIGNDLRKKEDAIIFRKAIRPLYRNATKSESKLLAPDKEFFTKYDSFLKNKNTGIVKLVRDQGCEDVAKSANTSKECSIYTMPGAGSSYSFRIDNYRLKNLGDLNFTGNNFQALGVLLHGVMVNLGDIPLENIDETIKGYQYVRDFQPADDFKKAAELATNLQKGIVVDGFTYASVLPAQADSTYILRSIAYKGESFRTVEGVTFNELEFDKRKDLTIVFRVLQKDNESVTLLWKELAEEKSPKLEAN